MFARRILLVLMGLFCLSTVAEAKTFTGRVKSLSADGKSVTVYSTVSKMEETFSLAGRELKVTVDSRPARTEDLQVGDIVTVFTATSGQPTRIIARKDSSGATASTPAVMPDKRPAGSARNPAPEPAAGIPAGNADVMWPQFLGPDRLNRSADKGLLQQWPAGGPRLLWTARNLGEGYSAVSVADGKVFTMGTRQGQEVVLAFDLKTGREVWSSRNGSIFNDNMGNGPRSTPTYDNGRLYCLGASGDLSCLNAATGIPVWQGNILSQFSASNIVWGISESPLIDGEKVICTPGGNGATMVALNKNTGAVLWRAGLPGNPQAGYASPIIAMIGGVKQYVNFCHSGLFGVNASTGEALWGDNNAANTTANCSSPIVVGNNAIFYASGYGTGGALIRFDGRQSRPSLIYKTERMKNHHGGMVQKDGFIYGANENILTCMNAETGTPTWQERLSGDGKGAITYADGQLYFRSEKGPMYLIEANPNEFRINGQFDQPERSGRQAWARPVVADGKLFLRDQDILLCFDLKQ